jgi:transcriptional regulator with XRE-family HTH domain
MQIRNFTFLQWGLLRLRWAWIIKRFRESIRLTQATFSELLGVDQATVSRWESDKQIPDLSMQKRIRDMLSRADAIPHEAFVRALVRAQSGVASVLDAGWNVVDFSQPLASRLGRDQEKLRGANLRDYATHRVNTMLDSHLNEIMRPGSPVLSVSHTDVGALIPNVTLRRTWTVLRVDGLRMLLCQDDFTGKGSALPPLDLKVITLDDVLD